MNVHAFPRGDATARKSSLLLAALFVAIIGIRLFSVYPPTLRHDPATIALQACRILDGERPIFWSGQAWMGAAGTYVEALLFSLFGKNTLVMSLYAWTASSVWIFFSLLLAWRFFGSRAAIYTAVLWLIPTKTLMYWSSQARNDFHAVFIATPVILLLTHDIVVRFRESRGIAGRVLFLGFFCGFSFWQNMAIGPCLVVTFVVLMLHLRRDFWTRYLWMYAPAWLLGFFPVLYYNLTTDVALVRQGRFKGLSVIAKAVSDLFTNVLPCFWGITLKGQPWTPWKAAQLGFVLWTLLLLGLYVGLVYRKWRRKEDLLADQLVLGLLVFHVLVPTVTQYGRSFATAGNPILYLTNLYSVAFVVPAVVFARWSGAPRLLLALPFLIYFGNNISNTLFYPQSFFSAWRQQGAAAIAHFPDPNNLLVRALHEKNLTYGYSDRKVPWLSLEGLHIVEVSRPAADRVADYALRVDGARDIFWVSQPGLSEAFAMIGSRFERGEDFFFHFQKDPAPETLLDAYSVRVDHDLPGAPFLSDRHVDTVWELPTPLPDSSIVFEFPVEQSVGKITLLPRDYKTIPVHLILQISRDGQTWKTVEEWKEADVFFWSVRHPFLKMVKPRSELVISRPEPVRFLRLVIPAQEGSCSLREVFLYRTDPSGSPAVTLDEEIDALAKTLEPVKKTHLIVGDHYFMSFFKLAGFDVEFLSNRTINNSGRLNPFLEALRELDFSRPLALIVPKSHSSSAARQLGRARISFEVKRLFYHDVYFTTPGPAAASLYWSGFDLLQKARDGGAGAAEPQD